MPDPSSPSTSSARDAVVEAMADTFPHAMDRYAEGDGGYTVLDYFRFVRLAMSDALDAALGVTYTPPCPVCWGRVNDIAPGATCKNPDCTDGRSAPRLALIDVLVASGVLEPETWADRSTGSLAYHVMVDDEGAAPNDPVPGHYRIPASEES